MLANERYPDLTAAEVDSMLADANAAQPLLAHEGAVTEYPAADFLDELADRQAVPVPNDGPRGLAAYHRVVTITAAERDRLVSLARAALDPA